MLIFIFPHFAIATTLSIRLGLKITLFVPPAYRCYMWNMVRISFMASEESCLKMLSDGWTQMDNILDGQQPAFTISSPMSLLLRWAKKLKNNLKQRTSGPVNAHLTPGPGIYSNAFIHVYSPRAGADNPLGPNVDVNRKLLPLCPFVAGFKTISLKSDFRHVFPHVYSPGQGQTTYWGQNFDDNRKAFSLCPYVASFKIISSKSDFIHIFNDFTHVYSPGTRAYNPLGTNFWCQQKALITLPIRCKFKKRNLIIYTF